MAQSSAGTVESNEVKELIPFGRNVLVRPVETDTYKGNLIIPDMAKDKCPVIGHLMSVGGKIEEEELEGLRPGDKVIYGKYSGVELKLDNNTRFIYLNIDDILGKVVSYDGLVEDQG